MSRLFGCFAYATGPVAPLLRLAGERARVPASENRHGYGLGYAQSGDVLLLRRPQVRDRPVDLAEAAADIRTNAFVAQVRRAEVGALKFENTAPFRFGPWMYAQVGTLPGDEAQFDRIRGQLPDSVQRNLAGETDAELFFHLFLSRLHDAGISPRLWSVEPGPVTRTLATTLTAWRLMAGTPAPGAFDVAAILTNGQSFFALRSGRPLHVLAVKPTPRDFLPQELGFPGPAGEQVLGTPACVLVLDGEAPPAGGVALPDRTVLSIDRDFRLAWHPAEL